MTSITKHVSLTPEMFDDALEMLEPTLGDKHTRNALEVENADAVWLVMVRNGTMRPPARQDSKTAIDLT